jgi:N-acetylneuraminic acid mutarotase
LRLNRGIAHDHVMEGKTMKPATLTILAAIAALILTGCTEETVHELAPVAPAVSGISPASGPAAGGTDVTVYGTLFGSGATVTFGGVAATSVTWVNEGQITCVTPAGAAGAVDVMVSGSTLLGGFTYEASDWTAPDWTRRAPITVTGSTDGDLTDFQIRLDIPYDDDMALDFSDLRFTHFDGTTETPVAFWRQTHTASVNALVWVRVPAIPASPATTTIYVYYGNPAAESDSDFDATFTKNFGETGLRALWHLDEGSGLTSADSSGNGADLGLEHLIMPYGWLDHDGGQWADRSDACFSTGSGLSFDGEESSANAGNPAALVLGRAMSIEAWVEGYETVCGREQVVAAKWRLDGSGFTTTSRWQAMDPGVSAWQYRPNMPGNKLITNAVAVNGKLYLIGGYDNSNYTNTVWEYDPDQDTWATKTNMPTARYGPYCGAVNGKIYVIGGYTGTYSDVVEEYDPSTDTWATGFTAMPTPRYMLSGGVINGKIYVCGGYKSGGSSYSNDTEEYDPATDTWVGKAAMPGERAEVAGAVLGGKLHILGGIRTTYESSNYEYDPVGNAWATRASLPAGRGRPCAETANGFIYLMGGYNGGARAETYRYDATLNTWNAEPPMARTREYPIAGAIDGRLFVFGGGWDAGDSNTCEELVFGFDGQGFDPDGYSGGVFDGRYIYFVPLNDGTTGPSSLVLRHDTASGSFKSMKSWAVFDPGANGVGTEGYNGGAFDGRYVYFAPGSNAAGAHGEVLRFDTHAAFDATASWTTFDAGAHGVGADPDGYSAAVFDGHYLYFVPSDNGTEAHGEVLRYDTQADFQTAASWTAFDPGAHGVGTDPDGYLMGLFDGRFIYFGPNNNGTERHGEFLRYDTKASFVETMSWTAFDPGAAGLGTDIDSYHGLAFDGRYLYATPWYNNVTYHTQFLRYDTRTAFDSLGSWTVFDPEAAGVGTGAGFHGAAFDGRYVYALPNTHGEVYRYDTRKPYTSTTAWSVFNVPGSGIGVNPTDFSGAVFDGRYIYCVPWTHASPHGEVVRYDTTGDDVSYKLAFSQAGQAGGKSGAPFGFTAMIETLDGHFTVSSNTLFASGTWHHVVMTYDADATSDQLSLYVDGALAANATATGAPRNSDAPFTLGTFFEGRAHLHGALDEVRVYGRALAANEAKAHYERRKYTANEPVAGAPGTEETR